MKKTLYISIFFSILPSILCFRSDLIAQTTTLDRALHLSGFEQIKSQKSNRQLFIQAENRTYNSDAEALYVMLKRMNEGVVKADSLQIFMTHHQQVIMHVATDAELLKQLFEGEISYTSWLQHTSVALNPSPVFSRNQTRSKISSLNKYSPLIELGYDFRYQLGNYNNHLRVGLDANPVLIQQLPLGFQINAGLNIPLYNDLDKNRYLRMQQLTLTHQKVLRKGLYAGTAAGFFSRNRAGIHTKIVQYLWDEIISLSFQTGYTVFTPLTGKVDDSFAEEKPFMVYTGAAEYRWRAYDLDIRLEYGQFLYHDSGLHVDVQRRFGETVIGLFALKTRLGSNYGFHVSIPLFPSKGTLVSGIRLRSASHLPVTYRYEGNDLIGRMYETGLDLQFRMKQVYPSYLMKQLETFFQ